MISKIPKIALLIGALAVAGQASAHGGGGWVGPAALGAVVGAAVVGSVIANQDRPVYVQQAPVYVQPQPVYTAPPPPVYYQPARSMCSNRSTTARHRCTTGHLAVTTATRITTTARVPAAGKRKQNQTTGPAPKAGLVAFCHYPNV